LTLTCGLAQCKAPILLIARPPGADALCESAPVSRRRLSPGDVEQASLERDFVDLARQAHRALGAERQPLELVVGRAESVPGIASIAAYCSVECRAGRDDKVTGASLS
jgi:hypothetical protein